MTERPLAEQARLMAMVYTAHADATLACFESKYLYNAWRPTSAINLADTDNNPATTADPSWTPVVATPNHPEYPAAHACATGATAEALKAFYGTDQVSFSFDSTVIGGSHAFASTQALVDEVQLARIAGGMHFRTATVAGNTLGVSVGRWVASRYFQPR